MNQLRLEDYDAIAFDIEGTLADTIPTHHTARREAFIQHGYGHITPEQHQLGPTYGSSPADIIGGVLHAAGEIEKNGAFKEHPTVQQLIAAKMRLFEEASAEGFDEMPGAINFVHAIAPRFVGRMAVVTSSAERFILPFLERYGLGSYFPEDHIITEDTMLLEGLEGKPAPDPYKLAMKRLNSSNLLVVEDTASGVASAKKAGATVIALGFEKHNAALFASGTLEYPPDAFVADYDEARSLLGV